MCRSEPPPQKPLNFIKLSRRHLSRSSLTCSGFKRVGRRTEPLSPGSPRPARVWPVRSRYYAVISAAYVNPPKTPAAAALVFIGSLPRRLHAPSRNVTAVTRKADVSDAEGIVSPASRRGGSKAAVERYWPETGTSTRIDLLLFVTVWRLTLGLRRLAAGGLRSRPLGTVGMWFGPVDRALRMFLKWRLHPWRYVARWAYRHPLKRKKDSRQHPVLQVYLPEAYVFGWVRLDYFLHLCTTFSGPMSALEGP